MTTHFVGTCGNCGGPVEVPDVWHGIYRPTPTCRECGATPRNAFGPRIEMNPSPRQQTENLARRLRPRGASKLACHWVG